jgi:hypothetical protein
MKSAPEGLANYDGELLLSGLASLSEIATEALANHGGIY